LSGDTSPLTTGRRANIPPTQPKKAFVPQTRVPTVVPADEMRDGNDSIKDLIDAGNEQAKQLGDLRQPAELALFAIEQGRRLRHRAANVIFVDVHDQNQAIQEGAQAAYAAAQLPTGYSVQANRSAQEGAARAFIIKNAAAVRTSVLREFETEAQEAGEQARAAVDHFRGQIDFKAGMYALAPGSFTNEETELSELLRADQRAQDAKQMMPSKISALYDAAIAADQMVVAQQIEQAAEGHLSQVVKEGTSVMARRADRPRDGIASEEIICAKRLLLKFANARLQRLPQEITLAQSLYNDLVLPLYRGIFGVDARTLKLEEVFAMAARGGISLNIDPAWLVRDLGPTDNGEFWPPGWVPRSRSER
jgi:hypothetical protein